MAPRAVDYACGSHRLRGAHGPRRAVHHLMLTFYRRGLPSLPGRRAPWLANVVDLPEQPAAGASLPCPHGVPH
jgi:hypothetical protein